MTDRDVIEHVARLFGGKKVYDMPPAKRHPDRLLQYRAHLTGSKAAELMRNLYPFLGQRRRAKIDEIIADYEAREPTQVRRKRRCSEAAAKRSRRSDGTFMKSVPATLSVSE
jgi:hypothetical protein